MKNRASGFIKQIIGVITSIAKAKSSLALKTTKMGALKSRLVILSLLRNKKVLLSTISHKLHALVAGQHDHDGEDMNRISNDINEEDESKAIVIYNNAMQNYQSGSTNEYYMAEVEDDDSKCPDLTHSLFDDDDDDDQDGGGGSVIERVRHSKEEEGEEFILEDEIDQVADLFIKKFHRQIRIQKQLSFKRYQEMLERSV